MCQDVGSVGGMDLLQADLSSLSQFHWQDPNHGTESSRGEKPPACFSVLSVEGSSPGRTSYLKIANSFPNCPAATGLAEKGDSLRAPKKNRVHLKQAWLIRDTGNLEQRLTQKFLQQQKYCF